MIENRDFIVFSDDWGRHPSSCQHIFKRIALKNRVLWVNTIGLRSPTIGKYVIGRGVEKIKSWLYPLRKINDSFYVYSPFMLPFEGIKLIDKFNNWNVSVSVKKVIKRLGFKDAIFWTTVPNVGNLLGAFNESLSVYYCTDDYSLWPGANRDLIVEQENALDKNSNIIFAVSKVLVDSKSKRNANVFYLPHGVDLEHFNGINRAEPVLPEEVRSIQRPRIGFFGLIYEKIDLDLIKYIAVNNPNYSIVMIGRIAVDVSRFSDVKNVYFLGPRPYEILPDYIKELDVCILPYVRDEQIARSSPLKLKECLAAGKPVVSIDLPEVREYKAYVYISEDYEDFSNKIRLSLQSDSDEQAKQRQAAVKGEGWDSKVEFISDKLNDLLSKKKKINVMHLRIVTGAGGGPEKTILLSTQRTDKEKFNVVSVYLKNKNDDSVVIREKAVQMGIVLHEVLEQGKFDWKAIKEIKKLIEKYDIDILDCHDYKSNLIGFILSKSYPIKLITTIHGWSGKSLKEQFYYFVDKMILRYFDKVIIVYQGMNSYLLRKGVSQARLVTIHNAIDADDFKRGYASVTIRAELKVRDTDILVGNVCRLSKEKNLGLFLLAAQKIALAIDNVKFILVGDGPEKDNLKRYANKLGIGDKVIFPGERKDIKNIYDALDVLMLTSLKEGLPNVVLEAMAMEVSVVATKVGGVEELVEDGKNGLLFEPNDVDGIANGVIKILKDKQTAENFKRGSRAKVCNEFSFAARTKKMEDLYLEVMGV